MKKIILTAFTLFFGAAAVFSASNPDDMLKKITWYGQSSIGIDAGKKKIFIDPVNISYTGKADIILITHAHKDHYSLLTIDALKKKGTRVISSFGGEGIEVLEPGKSIEIGGIKIEAVEAYNIVKRNWHPKESRGAGYIITVDGVRIYQAGDTERIPEMKDYNCDIAFLPLGQKFTMEKVDDAVQSALDVKAKIAIPMHFGSYEGTEADAKYFVGELTKKNVKSMILPSK